MVDDALAFLGRLIGVWSGQGTGGYPTIESFSYDEQLRFWRRKGDRKLAYEQLTWKTSVDPPLPSHWEVGMVRVLESGELELSNTQGGGRVEVLRGRVEPGGRSITLRSVHLGHDPRMVSSSRQIHVEGTNLTYEMAMATASVMTESAHLSASLSKDLAKS